MNRLLTFNFIKDNFDELFYEGRFASKLRDLIF